MTRLFFIYSDLYLFDISRKHPLIEKKFSLAALWEHLHIQKSWLGLRLTSLLVASNIKLSLNYLAASSVAFAASAVLAGFSVALTAFAVLAACTFTAAAGLLIGTPIEVSSAVLEVL